MYKIRLKNKIVVGDFYVSFNKKAMFITKAYNEATGYSIRKNNWIQIIKDCANVARPLLHKVLTDFFKKIRNPMMIQKKRDIATMCKNSQYTGLYNPTNISYKDFVMMQFEIQGMYDDLDIL